MEQNLAEWDGEFCGRGIPRECEDTDSNPGELATRADISESEQELSSSDMSDAEDGEQNAAWCNAGIPEQPINEQPDEDGTRKFRVGV